MDDENSVLAPAEARHLLRRTGFGALPADVARIVDTGETRGQAADRLLGFSPVAFKPQSGDHERSVVKWVKYMLKTKTPLQQKLVLFLHDHFATGFSKVQDIGLSALQIQLLQRSCTGDFKQLVKDISRDPAMMEFLDTVRNDKDVPNENYARELMELFTLGVYDSAGNPNYTQEDIVQIARAFTGWDYDRGKATFDSDNHDFMNEFPERGPKVIFSSTGGFGGSGRSFTVDGEGEAEIDAVVDILFDHTDTNGKNTVARRTAKRLLEYFAHPDPAPAVVDAVVTSSQFASTWSLRDLCRAIFVHDAFYASMAPTPFGAGTKKSVKWPIDYVVSTLRVLGVKPRGQTAYVAGGNYDGVADHLDRMGQVLMDPPSVFGWDWETSWISSATLLARYGFVRDLTSARGRSSSAFRPERLFNLGLTDPGQIVDAATAVVGLGSPADPAEYQLAASERSALIDYLTDQGAHPTLDLTDYDVRNTKLHGLFALLLQSPAYQLH